MKFSHTLTGAAGGVLLACAAAFAQDAAPAPAAPAGVGRPEVKTVGDWMVRCFPVASPGPCDIYQELDDQRTRQRVLSFSIAYIPSLNRHGIQITVPLEVSIQKGLTIITDSYTSPVMKFRYCDRTGCFVQMPLDNAAIESIGKSGPDAKVRIFADNGKAYDLRFSLKGFTAAHDSMAEQARAKGKAPAPAAPAAPPPAP
ncbi:MAG: invasion associated locus family protein [Alphaproteobacteria bacterium]|nr:invasion associated locus family protein [Alphaproteobacteria bacterium]